MKQEIKTITELKNNTGRIINKVSNSGNPVILTKNGKPNAVIVDLKSFKTFSNRKKIIQLIEDAENDISSGRVRGFDGFISEFKRVKKISN